MHASTIAGFSIVEFFSIFAIFHYIRAHGTFATLKKIKTNYVIVIQILTNKI